MKCESFMLRERRGQQASQLGKKQQACFISEADGESFTAPHSPSRVFCPANNGALREGLGGHKHKFSDCYKSFIFHGSRLTLEKAFHPRLLTVCTQGLAWTLAIFSMRQCDKQWWNVLFGSPGCELYWLGDLVYKGLRQSRYSVTRWVTHCFHLSILLTLLEMGASLTSFVQPPAFRVRNGRRKRVRFNHLWWQTSS